MDHHGISMSLHGTPCPFPGTVIARYVIPNSHGLSWYSHAQVIAMVWFELAYIQYVLQF